jgi:hypothetical protein
MLCGSHFCPFPPHLSVETLATGQMAVQIPSVMLNSVDECVDSSNIFSMDLELDFGYILGVP